VESDRARSEEGPSRCSASHALNPDYFLLSHRQRPRVLAVLPGLIPSTIIGVISPLSHLHQRGLISAEFTLEAFLTARALRRVDLVVFCRNMEPRYASALDETVSNGTPIIYDIDDNLLALQPDPRSAGASGHLAGQSLLRRYLQEADLVRVYSPVMENMVRGLTPRVERVIPPVDLQLVHPRRRRTKRTRIVYATSRFRGDKLAGIVVPALASILDEYSDRIEVHFWGYTPEELRRRRNVYSHKFIWDYEKYMREFSLAGYDIGLAPGLNDVFHLSKTNNKLREYGACRVAGIYSNTELYSACVVHGKSGLLVENTSESWKAAIALLVHDASLREVIQEEAYKYVVEVHSVRQFEQQWLSQIGRVLRDRKFRRCSAPTPLEHASNDYVRAAGGRRSDLWSFWRCLRLVRGLLAKGPVWALRSAAWFVRSLVLLSRMRRTAARASQGLSGTREGR